MKLIHATSLQAGASTTHFNTKVGLAPIHVAALSGYVDLIKMLMKGKSSNRADVNIPSKDGLTAFHILLAKLLDLAALENKSMVQRGPKPLTDIQLEEDIIQTFLCLQCIAEHKGTLFLEPIMSIRKQYLTAGH